MKLVFILLKSGLSPVFPWLDPDLYTFNLDLIPKETRGTLGWKTWQSLKNPGLQSCPILHPIGTGMEYISEFSLAFRTLF